MKTTTGAGTRRRDIRRATMARKPDKTPPKKPADAKAAVAAQFAEADAKAQPMSDAAFEELQAMRSVRGW